MASYREPEITNPINLCLNDGTLNPAGVGWSRHPLHRANLRGRWLSKKRWNYWAVTTETHFFAISISNRDYFGAIALQLGDFTTQKIVGKYALTPMGRGVKMPETVEGKVIFEQKGLKAIQDHQGNNVSITVEADDIGGVPLNANFELTYPKNHQTLSVVVPWNRRTFQYTSKHNTIPAKGTVHLGDQCIYFAGEQCFGCLDYGRGIWPRKFIWNWGAASGRQNGRLIGLNLGGKWTDGTNMNENGICVDGKLTKISEDLIWAYEPANYMQPWKIYTSESGQIDLTFQPFLERSGALVVGFYKFFPFQIFGHYSGALITEDGELIQVHNLLGWAEEVYGQW